MPLRVPNLNQAMQKVFLLFSAIFLYSSVCICPSYASDQTSAPVAQNTVPTGAPAQFPDDGGLIKLNSQDMENIFKGEELLLKKIKDEHIRQERKQHVQITEKVYQEAKSLYHHKRRAKARQVFAKVEDSMADYKMTNSYLRSIDNRAVEQLRQRMRRIREMQGTQLVINLAQRASTIYERTAALGDDASTASVRDKLSKVKEVLEKLKQEKLAAARQIAEQTQLDQIAQQADNFDQEVYNLANAKDYTAAKKEYDEFQAAMMNELVKLKHNLIHGNRQAHAMSQDELLKEKGYRVQVEAVFRQGVDLYRRKQYHEAKSIFEQLAYQGDGRAKAYLKKIERLLQ